MRHDVDARRPPATCTHLAPRQQHHRGQSDVPCVMTWMDETLGGSTNSYKVYDELDQCWMSADVWVGTLFTSASQSFSIRARARSLSPSAYVMLHDVRGQSSGGLHVDSSGIWCGDRLLGPPVQNTKYKMFVVLSFCEPDGGFGREECMLSTGLADVATLGYLFTSRLGALVGCTLALGGGLGLCTALVFPGKTSASPSIHY